MIQVLFVRPYGERIQSEVQRVVISAGFDAEGIESIEAGTSDELALSRTLAVKPELMVIPFHVHRDAEGRELNGLEFLRKLRELDESMCRVGVLMPVSDASRATLRLRASVGDHAPLYQEMLDRQVMLIGTADLEVDDLGTELRRHVEQVRSGTAETSGILAFDR